MTGDDAQLQRLRFLARVVQRESKHLLTTDRRVFAKPFTQDRAKALAEDVELAERVEAFAARFGRLQDTLGDKLIPALLRALGEPVGAAIDNLDRAERLGWLPSSEQWLIVRRLRNQMVHDYIEDPAILASALQMAHTQVPMLIETSRALLEELDRRGWSSP
ncbi:hypothetical protein [Thermomonas sp. LB-4]|uniref:hypothetical protein n=1 Tax=Thermomonas sp. LB-4 TaxID=3102790 RepID=UPI002ED8B4CC